MSEYQYYEFQAIDRSLDRAAQKELRSISSRARITATSFTNHYEWGDLKGDPRKFVEQWFDLHLYLTNWGSRRLMMRLPKRLLKRARLAPFLSEADWVKVWASGDSLIVDIFPDETEAQDDWDDGSGWLADLAPLRGDVLSGDLRLFYLLWLMAVQQELVADDDAEPLPGIGPVTSSLEAFAAFFGVDPDLMLAAAEQDGEVAIPSKDDLRETLAAISDDEKTKLLLRIVDGDPHVAAELKNKAREADPASTIHRSAGELRIRAREIAEARERADAERREAERRRQAEEAERTRRTRLNALGQRGADVWREIDKEIERRNASGYDRAAALLSDLQVLATEAGGRDEFNRRLASLRTAHQRKPKFIERMSRIGRDNDAEMA
ncbi:hypothetical protein SAMN05216304_1011047 [Bosea sp. OK403]|uniref:hypothetical protein n=1 Tax=Bosea sp. OK403 TaxID=1855286 RepID=UPI0008EDEFC4|nr:hypothetical protein [Bosea sp. OK403]SFI13774.1 hypothetical protein SAMN05216304_1011047 [Bosea sp. OK403]